MPLKSGYSYATAQANIAQLIKEGYDRAQAVAIAYNWARKCYFKRYPHGALPEWLTPIGGGRLKPKRAKNPISTAAHVVTAAASVYGATKRAKNPVPAGSRSQTVKAMKLYEEFSGHDAQEAGRIEKPVVPDVLIQVGTCDGILYTTVRDGVTEKYIHKFKARAKPVFCVSPDGEQIFLIGGDFTFTERGIVDN